MQFLLSDVFGYEIEVSAGDRLVLIGVLAVLGAVLGSFMNVVIYRLPRRMSLSHPGSRCPKCEHPIRWHDNVPVVGWLILRGRCRDCGAPIAPRYPLVEALVAVVGGLLAWKAPLLVVTTAAGDDFNLYAVDVAWIAFHLLLACVLICAALIEFDGFVPPKWLIGAPLLVGLAVLIAWPHLQPGEGDGALAGLPIGGLRAGIVGMLTALALGAGPWLTWYANTRQSGFAYATRALGELVLVGGFLGHHAVVSIGLESMVLYVATQLLSRKWPAAGRFGWAGPLTLVTLVWTLAGPDVVLLNPRLSQDFRIRLIVAGSLMIILAVVLQIVPSPRQQPTRPE